MKLVSVVLLFLPKIAFAQTNTGAFFDDCTVDSDCLSPYKCIGGSTCAWGPNAKGQSCTSNSDCTNGYCDPVQNICEDCVDDAGCGDGNHCAVGNSVSFCFTGAIGDRCFSKQPDGTPVVDKSCDCGLACDEEADDWQAAPFEPAPGIGLCVCNEPNPRLCQCRRSVDPDKIKGPIVVTIGDGKKPINVEPPVSEKPVKNLRGVESGGK